MTHSQKKWCKCYSPVRNFGPLHHRTYFSSIKDSFLTKARLSPRITRISPKSGSQFEDMPQALSTEKLARIRAGLEMNTDQKTIAQRVASASGKLPESSTISSSMAQSSALRNLVKDANLKLQKEWPRYVFVLCEKVADFVR